MTQGCPVCDWDGGVSHTFDSSHKYYTHVIVKDGETFTGTTCSMRTKPTDESGIFGGLFS